MVQNFYKEGDSVVLCHIPEMPKLPSFSFKGKDTHYLCCAVICVFANHTKITPDHDMQKEELCCRSLRVGSDLNY